MSSSQVNAQNDQTVVDIPLIQSSSSNDNLNGNSNATTNNSHDATNNYPNVPDFELMSPAKINQAIKEVKDGFQSGRTKDVKFRKQQLKKLLQMFQENKGPICEAVKSDLNKPSFETMLGEFNLLINEILEHIHEADNYVKPEQKGKTLLTLFDNVYVQQEPLGTVLIMGAWNYPVLLAFQPVAGAIVAGNAVIIKMSEHSPCTGKLLADLASKYLDTSCYRVINCDLPTTQYLLAEHKFDQIFYTGGDNGGKAVYAAASKTLTPVVLELGGKSPVYIDDDVCDCEAVWSRLFWGKFLNAGQTCIAPDYVLCSEKAQQVAKKQFQKIINQFYSGDATKSGYYPRIVNCLHFERLKKLLKESRIVVGGKLNSDALSIEPAIVLDVALDDPIMKEEIFGPVLPFVTCSSSQRAIDIINSRPKPLALYVFSDSKKLQDKFLKQTSSGGVCINDTILHISATSLPFGGVGGSGFGKYHGRYSFETFSNPRAVLKRGFNPMLEWIGSNRYPPYTDTKLTILTQLGLNRKFWYPGPLLRSCLVFATGAASVLAFQTLSGMYT